MSQVIKALDAFIYFSAGVGAKSLWDLRRSVVIRRKG